MKKPKRPDFIVNARTIEAGASPPQSTEDFGFASELAGAAGMTHLRVAQLRVPPGMRAYPPLAMDDLEIFAFVLAGAPDLWLDGYLYRLKEGDGVVFHAGTGDSHSIINNGDTDARVFVMSEPFRRNSRVKHHRDETSDESLKKMNMFWADAPRHKLGPNSGKPGDLSGRKSKLPGHVTNWRDILEKKPGNYPKTTEDMTYAARFGRRARFSRIGIHLDLLKPGRRTSYPHAERDEEEFVHVVSGKVDCWIDGHLHPMGEGDFVGFPARTGITHTIINNSDTDAILLTGGEANRMRNQFWYPYQPSQNEAVGDLYWADHPVSKLGPHDGLPDALRARLPKSALRNPITANQAVRYLKKPKTKR